MRIFHRDVKVLFGLEDFAGKAFEAIEAHVYWVYSAYILMSMMKIDGRLTALKNVVSKVI